MCGTPAHICLPIWANDTCVKIEWPVRATGLFLRGGLAWSSHLKEAGMPHRSKNDRMEPDGHLDHVDELLFSHTRFPETRPSRVIDAVLTVIGKATSWFWLIVVGLIIYAVVGRYAFGQGSVTLEEWQWHIAGAAWLLGLAYTLCEDDHVRVDVLHERFSLKVQGWIELFGILLLLVPFLGFAILEAVPYALHSFQQGETSNAPAGLANRWILKAILASAFVLLLMGALSRLTKVTAFLFGFPTAIIPVEKDTA